MTNPNFTVAPGAFIDEWLEDNNVTQQVLAQRMGVSAKHVSKLLDDDPAPITAPVAQSLARVTGTPAKFWLQAESLYRSDLVRLAEDQELAEAEVPLSAETLKQLRDRGFITADRRHKVELFHQLFDFFGVGNFKGLMNSLVLPKEAVAYRQGRSRTPDYKAVATWLRLGHLEAEQQDELSAFDKPSLESAVPEIVELTAAPVDRFGPTLVQKLGECGVHLLYVEDLPRTYTYGATWWMGENPVVQLSLRGRSDDHFWFTLMHEIGHLIKHTRNRGKTFVQYEHADDSTFEQEANEYAVSALISPEIDERLGPGITLTEIQELAHSHGIAPGILVGQCHHRGFLQHQYGRGLIKSLAINADDDGV